MMTNEPPHHVDIPNSEVALPLPQISPTQPATPPKPIFQTQERPQAPRTQRVTPERESRTPVQTAKPPDPQVTQSEQDQDDK